MLQRSITSTTNKNIGALKVIPDYNKLATIKQGSMVRE